MDVDLDCHLVAFWLTVHGLKMSMFIPNSTTTDKCGKLQHLYLYVDVSMNGLEAVVGASLVFVCDDRVCVVMHVTQDTVSFI